MATAGLRKTAPRLAVLEVLERFPHSDAETVATHVKEKLGSVSRQAVYDVLATLNTSGLIRRTSPHGRISLYEIERHDNHHHFLCDDCGLLQDIPCAIGAAPCLRPDAVPGASITLVEVLYRGYCAPCHNKRNGENS